MLTDLLCSSLLVLWSGLLFEFTHPMVHLPKKLGFLSLPIGTKKLFILATAICFAAAVSHGCALPPLASDFNGSNSSHCNGGAVAVSWAVGCFFNFCENEQWTSSARRADPFAISRRLPLHITNGWRTLSCLRIAFPLGSQSICNAGHTHCEKERSRTYEACRTL